MPYGAGKPGKFGDAAVIEGKNWIKDMETQAGAIGSNKNSKHMSELTKAEVKNELKSFDQRYINKFIINEIKDVFEKIEKKEKLTSEEITYATQKAAEYYDHIVRGPEVEYGKIALDVLNQRTPFGKTAHIHLETAAKNNGLNQEAINRIMQEYPIYLAFRDAEMRTDPKQNNLQESRDIAQYHYDGLKLYNFPKEAWGRRII